jgi:hypothetical protein
MTRSTLLTLLAAALLVLLSGCGGDGASAPKPSSTPVLTKTAPAEGTPVTPDVQIGVSTPPDLGSTEFGREPVEQPPGEGRATRLLVGLQTGNFEDYDRVIFQLDGGMPGYRVEYVTAPATACGSGAPVSVAGQALLQVRLSLAAAHDETGAATIGQTEITAGLPALLELEQTCDVEGEVVWVLGLASEVDFRVFVLAEALLVIDVMHP